MKKNWKISEQFVCDGNKKLHMKFKKFFPPNLIWTFWHFIGQDLLENIWCGIYSSSDDIYTYIGQDTHAYMRLTYMYM